MRDGRAFSRRRLRSTAAVADRLPRRDRALPIPSPPTSAGSSSKSNGARTTPTRSWPPEGRRHDPTTGASLLLRRCVRRDPGMALDDVVRRARRPSPAVLPSASFRVMSLREAGFLRMVPDPRPAHQRLRQERAEAEAGGEVPVSGHGNRVVEQRTLPALVCARCQEARQHTAHTARRGQLPWTATRQRTAHVLVLLRSRIVDGRGLGSHSHVLHALEPLRMPAHVGTYGTAQQPHRACNDAHLVLRVVQH